MAKRPAPEELSRRDLLTFWRRAPTPEEVPPPPPPEPPRADLDWARCIAYRDIACDSCLRVCPVEGALQVDHHGHPRVDIYRCTGCGECEKVCPTDPPSIVVRPRPPI